MRGIIHLFIMILFSILAPFTQSQSYNQDMGGHPGLSMSLDLKALSQAKDVYLSTIIKQINGQSLPNITLSGGDGHMKSNRVFIKQKAKNVKLYTDESRNAYIVEVKNLYLFMRSQDFRYNMWFVPVKATLDAEIAQVGLDFEVNLMNETIEYINPHTNQSHTRVVPKIKISKCALIIDPKLMKFNIGGSFVASVVDVILPLFTKVITLVIEQRMKAMVEEDELPALFNDAVAKSGGFIQMGDAAPIKEWENTTFDYQVSRFGIIDSQLQLAFNGTIFNNLTTGYRVLENVPLPINQPFHDPNIESTMQLFISTYLLEHMTRTLFDEAPFDFYMVWDMMPDPTFWLTTSTLEGCFPMLTQQFGDNIPIDLNFQITRTWDFRSSRENRRLSFKIEMRAQAYLHIPDGSRHYIGLLEWYEGEVWISVFSQGMLFKGEVQKFEFQTAYSQTSYGISRYETSPFILNVSIFASILIFKEDFIDLDLVAVPSDWGYFTMKDLHLDYYDEYIAMGITPQFKRYNASDFNVTTKSTNKTMLIKSALPKLLELIL